MLNGFSFHDFATLLSLGLTIPGIVICILVMYSWFPEYKLYCKSRNKKPSGALIAGIWIAFFGSMFDNTWWGAAWTMDYIAQNTGSLEAKQWRDWLFSNGVYSNVVFRQGALIWAGALHVHAENMSRETGKVRKAKRTTKIFISLSIIASCLYLAFLINL